MRKLSLISCAIVLCMGAIAQDFETIYTSSGNIYTGYISEQIPGNTISVYATEATLTLAMNDIQNLRDEYRQVDHLSPTAQQYFKSIGDSSAYVKLCSFDYQGAVVDDALLVNQTNDSLHVRIFTPKTYRLAWKEIHKVQKNITHNASSAVLDVVALKDGSELRGRVIEQVMGKTLTIHQNDTTQTTISASNVSSLRIDISAVEDAFNHMPLLDVLVLKNDSVLSGIVLSRMMGKHITILLADNNQEKILPLTEIRSYRKIQNPNYDNPIIVQDTISSAAADTIENVVVSLNGSVIDMDQIVKYKDSESTKYVLVRNTNTVKPADSVSVSLHNYTADSLVIYKLHEHKNVFQKSTATSAFPTFDSNEDPYLRCVCTENADGVKEAKFALQDKGKYIVLIDETKGIIINIE